MGTDRDIQPWDQTHAHTHTDWRVTNCYTKPPRLMGCAWVKVHQLEWVKGKGQPPSWKLSQDILCLLTTSTLPSGLGGRGVITISKTIPWCFAPSGNICSLKVGENTATFLKTVPWCFAPHGQAQSLKSSVGKSQCPFWRIPVVLASLRHIHSWKGLECGKQHCPFLKSPMMPCTSKPYLTSNWGGSRKSNSTRVWVSASWPCLLTQRSRRGCCPMEKSLKMLSTIFF